ncbi:Hypothetical protein HVR_LOCUS598 [uncultured virus]|nr:Hypothetical protein HVR_LOCUS598 [uncultured virus]
MSDDIVITPAEAEHEVDFVSQSNTAISRLQSLVQRAELTISRFEEQTQNLTTPATIPSFLADINPHESQTNNSLGQTQPSNENQTRTTSIPVSIPTDARTPREFTICGINILPNMCTMELVVQDADAYIFNTSLGTHCNISIRLPPSVSSRVRKEDKIFINKGPGCLVLTINNASYNHSTVLEPYRKLTLNIIADGTDAIIV